MNTDNQKTKTNGEILSGIIMAVLLALTCISALKSFYSAAHDTDAASKLTWVNGKYAAAFEKNFNSGYLFFEPAKSLWGDIEYAFFQGGRDGVLIGEDGWLFSTEEFSILQNRQVLITDHMNYIQKAASALKSEDIKLIIALIPAKARIHNDKLGAHTYPTDNHALYSDVLSELRGSSLIVPDLYKGLSSSKNAFLRTDTHWSPDGAHQAAKLIAEAVKSENIKLERTQFTTQPSKSPITHKGDLTRYTPGSLFAKANEELATPVTSVENQKDTANNIFGDTTIPVTLVGTSYSANPLWHFEGYLKSTLQADVLNVADEGQGPFETMKAWLDSSTYKEAKPQLVIWEIPERYISLPDVIRE